MTDAHATWDRVAPYYDDWIPPDAGDVEFYVEAARRCDGPVVELGPGTGRVTLPLARAGVRVIGVDWSAQMLEICRRRAAEEGVAEELDLRVGDFRRPPVQERVGLVICPFRSFMHLPSDADRREALRAVHRMLQPRGQFIFDVFAPPADEDDPERSQWVERGATVAERDEIDWARRVVHVFLRTESGTMEIELAWLDRVEWRALLSDTGFEVHACYGWFDLRPCGLGTHSVWVARRRE
jgi:SAM-dependent methyltransferase